MASEQKNLYQAIDDILWTDWDPIGINDDGGPRDEYQMYTPAIFGLKIHREDIETMAGKLYEIETERMGLPGNMFNCRQVAGKIIGLK